MDTEKKKQGAGWKIWDLKYKMLDTGFSILDLKSKDHGAESKEHRVQRSGSV